MTRCSALNCKNRGVHRFPKDPKRRKLWENALRIKNFKASNASRLCAKHFKEDDYFGQSKYTSYEPLAKFLKKSAVPSIFCFTKEKPVTPAAFEHQYCIEKQSQLKWEIKQESTDMLPTSSENVMIDVPLINIKQEEITPHCQEQDMFDMLYVTVNEEVISTSIEDHQEDGIIIEVPLVNDKEHAMSSEVLQEERDTNSSKFASKSTQANLNLMYGSIHRHKDDKSMKFYTGFESYKKFSVIYLTISPMAQNYSGDVLLSTENQFFLTMMKLRQNICIFELSIFFNISKTIVCNIFITMINVIYQRWSELNIWPDKKLIEYYMPKHYKKYAKHEVILDLEDREVTINHVNIKRIIQLTRTYKILKFKLHQDFVPLATKIFYVCFMCCYFRHCKHLEQEIKNI